MNLFREKLGIGAEKKIFLYQGGLRKGRGIEILLETFMQIDPEHVIVFMGDGPLAKLVEHTARHYDNIYHIDAVPQQVLLSYTSSADYGILFYENSCLNHYYCSPNKIFEYMMSGLPVVVSNLFEMRKLVNGHGIGTVASQNNVEGLDAAIKEIAQQDRKRLQANINALKSQYNWEAQEKVLLATYEEVHA